MRDSSYNQLFFVSSLEAIPSKPIDDFDFDPECGPGWEAAADFCYKVNPDATTWATAKQNCHNAGPESDLLYITTKQEEMLIRCEFNV
jgi:hypothetical protein